MSRKGNDKLKELYPDHYKQYVKVAEAVNNLTDEIQELGKLPKTGEPNIDNLYDALTICHHRTISIFIEKGEQDA